MLPREQILAALLVDLKTAAAAAATPFKVRHERFRSSTAEEWPCVSIRYLGDDAPGVATGSDTAPSLAEEAMELRLELIVDTPLPAESDQETAEDPDDGDDPTGFGVASAIVETCLGAIFTEGQPINTLGGLIWDARYDGSGDNDDLATPDNVRLAERLTLVYRVRAEAPHVLLIGD